MSVILCENISIKKREKQINSFNFNFLDKQIYGIVGKSDSGKELLLDLLSSKVNPKSGDIWVDGENLKHNDEMQSRICYMPRNIRFSDLLTVKGLFKKKNYKKHCNRKAKQFVRLLEDLLRRLLFYYNLLLGWLNLGFYIKCFS